MNRKLLLPAALCATALTGLAQTEEKEVRIHAQAGQRMMVVTEGMDAHASAGPGTFAFVSAGMSDGKVVKGAPYSAEATTETTRMLADGTRIVSRNTSVMARDKEGRSRRENNLTNIGPLAGAQAPRFVTITDPVAKEVYILNVNDRTASKVKMGEPMIYRSETTDGNKKQVMEHRMEVKTGAPGAAAAGGTFDVMIPPSAGTVMHSGPAMMRWDSRNGKTENLGKQNMEGLVVEGTRTTNTIPAGEIGNDRPIVSTTERWYSPDLQMVIFTKTVDPQFGESVYRVGSVRRTEPDPSQFRIPADFKIQENAPGMMMRKRMATPADHI